MPSKWDAFNIFAHSYAKHKRVPVSFKGSNQNINSQTFGLTENRIVFKFTSFDVSLQLLLEKL